MNHQSFDSILKTSDNWMLDQTNLTLSTYYQDSHLLTLKLTIEKIEYGRICLAQILHDTTDRLTLKKWRELDYQLKNKIIELGGEPREINNNGI